MLLESWPTDWSVLRVTLTVAGLGMGKDMLSMLGAPDEMKITSWR